MTVQITREGWLAAYSEERAPSGFLSRFFSVPRGGIYNGEEVALDIKRIGEQVSTVVKKCTGPNMNDIDQFTTKEFKPPALHEGFSLQNCEFAKRPFGTDPFAAAYQDFMVGVAGKMASNFATIGYKVDRHIELQASQILQTGSLALPGEDGTTAYDIDFKTKATHFPTVSIPWSTSATATPLTDIEALAAVIRADGRTMPDTLLMDGLTLENFLSCDQVKERADVRRYELVSIEPRFENSGATFYGSIQVGAYRFQIWTYPETYQAPVTLATTEYLSANKMVMLSSQARLDMTFARAVPPFVTDPRLSGLVPGRISSSAQGFDVQPHAYVSQDGREIIGEIQSCPLLIPVALDSFGCLTTTV